MKKIAATFVLCALAAPLHAQKLERINPDALFKNPNYTQVVKVGKMIFVAGQVGVKPDGKVIGPGMKQQFEQALSNLTTALKSVGADLTNVATMTTFTTSMEEFRAPEVLAVRANRFGKSLPASTLVQVVKLASPDYKVEIEATAVLP